MYQRDLRVPVANIRRLGLVVNIGLVGHVYPLRRRWLTTHFLQTQVDPARPDTVVPLLLSSWSEGDDTFEHAEQAVLDDLAAQVGLTPAEFTPALQARIACLEEVSQGQGIGLQEMYEVIERTRQSELTDSVED